MNRIRRIVATALVLVAAHTVTAVAAPMIVLYGTPQTNRKIVKPGTADALPLDGRVFVQEPNVGHLFAGDADRPYRLSGLLAEQLIATGSAEGMAALLRRRIDEVGCPFPRWGGAGCQSHLVFIDELDHRFAETAPNLRTRAWRGPRATFPKYVPTAREGQPGLELSQAMTILASTPFRGGGTYADRVHFYIAPGMVTSLGVGRGPHHNLGRDGRPHFRSYEGVRPALQLAGGVWLEMYHFNRATRTRSPFNTYEWQVYPWRFTLYLAGVGAQAQNPALTSKVHFLMTRGMPKAKSGAPPVCRRRTGPQACQFKLATSPKNLAIVANGVGQYRMEGNEAEWRTIVRRLYFR